jgi:hypothetical protein
MMSTAGSSTASTVYGASDDNTDSSGSPGSWKAADAAAFGHATPPSPVTLLPPDVQAAGASFRAVHLSSCAYTIAKVNWLCGGATLKQSPMR